MSIEHRIMANAFHDELEKLAARVPKRVLRLLGEGKLTGNARQYVGGAQHLKDTGQILGSRPVDGTGVRQALLDMRSAGLGATAASQPMTLGQIGRRSTHRMTFAGEREVPARLRQLRGNAPLRPSDATAPSFFAGEIAPSAGQFRAASRPDGSLAIHQPPGQRPYVRRIQPGAHVETTSHRTRFLK